MNGSIYSAIVGAAMELGLFWMLADKSQSAEQVAQSLNIPLNRCSYWLQLLCKLGLLENTAEGYSLTTLARRAILDVQDQDTWAFQAREDRDLALYVQNLAQNIHQPMSAWQADDQSPAEYFLELEQDPTYTSRFTRKLYQIHLSLAEQLAGMLDLQGVDRLLDLGGGSGVVSFALLRKSHQVTSVVVDTESVCQEGRRITLENKLEKRITYLAGDFLKDDLPTGFDLVLLCDVGVISEILLRKIRDVINPGGYLTIIDKFAPRKDSTPPSRLLAAFIASLASHSQSLDYITMELVRDRLQQAGFRGISSLPVPHTDNLPWNIDWTLLEARK